MWRKKPVRMLITALVAGPFLAAGLFIAAVILTPLPRPQSAETTQVLDASGNRITRLYTENRIIVPVTEMPAYLLNGIVAVEDDRFYSHRGIDPWGLMRALVRNVTAGRIVEGGSTLTQQLAKNLYLTHERTLTRKLKEAVLTIKLEYTYSKTEILGLYWNTIYLGQGTYGAEVAAQTYFAKGVRDLTLAEAAQLAALPQAPELYSRPENYDAWLKRRDVVLDKMAQQGYITTRDARQAKATALQVTQATSGAGGGGAEPDAPFFMDLVMRQIQEWNPKVAKDVRQGGYRITTSLDLNMQRQANSAVSAELRRDPSGRLPQVALVALDPHTGYVKALVGGRGSEVDLNRALEPQQPGSAFKPFVYAAALESRSFTALSTQMDAPAEFPGARAGQVWRPQNANGRYSYSPATMREALRRSLNVVTAQWMNTIKPGPVIALAKRMGVESRLDQNLTIGLGSSAVTPLELARAYAPFANGGTAVKPLLVLRIEDSQGNVLLDRRPERTQALDGGVAFIVTDMLKDVLRPGGTAAGVAGYLGGRPAAGKTGTTDEGRDAWFVGYTPDLVTAVWVGEDDNRPSNREGASAAAPVWARFMSGALVGRRARDWTPPPGVVAVDICTLTGLLPNPTCPVDREWFLNGTAPAVVDPTLHTDRLLPGPAPGEALPPDLAPGTPEAPFGTGAPVPPLPGAGAPPQPPTLQDLFTQLLRWQ